MKILNRLKTAFKARMNKVLDEVEDPEELLDISLQEMKEHLQQVKKSLLDVTTLKKGLESELAEVKDKVNLAQVQAETAMNVNREDLARAALEKKAVLEDKKSSLLNEIEKIEKRIIAIKDNKRTLAEQITSLENKREELIAINKSADAQLAVKEIVAGVSNDITDLNEQIKRAEEKIREKEAKVSAIDELVSQGEMIADLDSQDTVEKSLKEIQRETRIEEELTKLKLKKTGGE
jgi:phage shock protein A